MSRLSPRAWVALTAIYIIWGSTYLAIAIAVETMPPLLMAGTRFIVAGLVMLAAAWHLLERKPGWIELRNATIVGTGLCLGGNGLVSIAETRIESGMAALIIATVPLWLTGLDRAIFGVRLARLTVVGLMLGFAGTAVLVRPGGGSDTIGALLVVAASALWACASLFARRSTAPEVPAVNVGLQMFMGGIVTLVAATLGGEWGRLNVASIETAGWLAWGYLIVAGSIGGFSAYVWLLRNVETHIAGTYAYVNPVIAVGLGAAILNERIDSASLGAGLVVILAVAAIIAGGTRKKGPIEPPPEPA